MSTNKPLIDNYAYDLRGFGGEDRLPSVPRPNFTFFVEFGFNSEVENSDIYDKKYNRGNSIFVKGFTKPGFSFNIEELRSYNTKYNLKTKSEYEDITLNLYDDSRSQARSLLNSYRDHYTSSQFGNADRNEYGNDVTTSGTITGQSLAEAIANNPSQYNMGLKTNSMASSNFFSYIRLIDLGVDPNAAQVYMIYMPVIKTVNAVELDYSDGTGMQEISVTLSYSYFDTYEYNDSGDLHNQEGLFETHLNKAVIEDHNIKQVYDEKLLRRFDDILPDNVTNFLNGIGVTPGELLQAVQNSIQGGELNLDDLRRNIFETVASGTPIQNIRNVITNIRLIEQALTQGRFLDILPLIGEGAGQLGNLKNFDPFGSSETISNVRDTISSSVGNLGSWISRHGNPLG